MRASRHLLWPPPPPRHKQAVQCTTGSARSVRSAPLGRWGSPRRACRRLSRRCAPARPLGRTPGTGCGAHALSPGARGASRWNSWVVHPLARAQVGFHSLTPLAHQALIAVLVDVMASKSQVFCYEAGAITKDEETVDSLRLHGLTNPTATPARHISLYPWSGRAPSLPRTHRAPTGARLIGRSARSSA